MEKRHIKVRVIYNVYVNDDMKLHYITAYKMLSDLQYNLLQSLQEMNVFEKNVKILDGWGDHDDCA